MKVYTRVVIDMATSQVLEADWYEYDGPVAQCGKGGKAPKAPDPNVVSQAQTQSNQDTAAFNAALNRTNTYTPAGSSEFTVTGTDPTTGAPIYRQDVKLAPDAQALYDQQMAQNRRLGDVTQGMTERVGQTYAQPMDTSSAPKLFGADDLLGARQQAQDSLYKRQTAYLDPQWAQREEAFRTRMANQGITEGNEAWVNAKSDEDRARSFDYGQAREAAIGAGAGETAMLADISGQQRGQTMQELYAERARPLNEFNALRSSSQVDMPQFDGATPASAPPSDVAGNVYNTYQGDMAKWNAQQVENNNLTAGLFGLGSAALMAFSDERLKENVEKVGKLPGGPNVYEYEMRGDPTDARQVGVMAQEVERTQPEAVINDPSGYKKVDYAQVLARAMKGKRRAA